MLIPLIVSAIRRSLELAEAMESRAWGATKKRTNLYLLRLHKGDFALLAITVGILSRSCLHPLLYVPDSNNSQPTLIARTFKTCTLIQCILLKEQNNQTKAKGIT